MEQMQPDKLVPPSLLTGVLQRLERVRAVREPISVQHLGMALTQPDWTLRAGAIERVEDPSDADELASLDSLLRAALKDEHAAVRAAAVAALGRIGRSEAMLPAFKDGDWQVREAAVLSLTRASGLDEQTSSEALSMALQDLDIAVRDSAHYVLQQTNHAREPYSFTSANVMHSANLQSGQTKMQTQENSPAVPDLPGVLEERVPGTMEQQTPVRHSRPAITNRTAKRTRLSPLWRTLAACAAVFVLVLSAGLWTNLIYQHQHADVPPASHGQGSSTQGQLVYTYTFANDQFMGNLAWSPDGKHIAVAEGPEGHGHVTLWDATSGKHRVTYTLSPSTNSKVDHDVYATSLSWSPDGKHLAVAMGDIQILNTSTGKLENRYFPQLSSLFGTVNAVAWSPDGQYIAGAYADTDAKTGVCIWDVRTGEMVHSFAADRQTGKVAWSPNSKYLAVDGDTISIWNATTGQKVLQLANQYDATSLAWSPDSTRIASYGTDKQKVSALRIWNALSGKVLVSSNYEYLTSIAWSPDGRRLAVSGITVQLLDASNGKVLYTYPGQVSKLSKTHVIGPPYLRGIIWSPDGKLIASGLQSTVTGGGNIQVWKAE